MYPGKQLSQLPEELQERQPSVDVVIPHWKHFPVIVRVNPKEQEKHIVDLFCYSYLHFAQPSAHGTHFSDISLFEFLTLETKAKLSKH